MRQPNHIILDFNTPLNSTSSQYWAINFLSKESKTPEFLLNSDAHRKYLNSDRYSSSHKLFQESSKYTIISLNNKSSYTSEAYKQNLLKLFSFNKAKGYTDSTLVTKHVSWYNLININFIRKERLYTKLKYSRSPAYDSVSGGAAAILAGLIGFLISEKFGIELVDSGDFYYLFMYIVFLSFSIRPLLLVAEVDKSFIYLFSLKRVLSFYISIISVFFNWLKSLFNY